MGLYAPSFKLFDMIKVKVTSEKFDKGISKGKVILIPKHLVNDFLKFEYGEIVKESPEKIETPEKKRGRPKTKE